MKKKLLSLTIGVMIIFGVLVPAPAYAAVVEGDRNPGCEKGFLGLRPWYSGLSVNGVDGKCAIGSPVGGDDGLPAFVWTIILNILADLAGIVGYAAVLAIIYGGFQFIMSNGEPGKVAKGKTTITSAVIGLAITLLATIIVNTILGIIT